MNTQVFVSSIMFVSWSHEDFLSIEKSLFFLEI